jgi:hypothetical protein
MGSSGTAVEACEQTDKILLVLKTMGAHDGRRVADSTPEGFTGIFLCHNPSSRTMAPASTQPLTEISTRNISWG